MGQQTMHVGHRGPRCMVYVFVILLHCGHEKAALNLHAASLCVGLQARQLWPACANGMGRWFVAHRNAASACRPTDVFAGTAGQHQPTAQPSIAWRAWRQHLACCSRNTRDTTAPLRRHHSWLAGWAGDPRSHSSRL